MSVISVENLTFGYEGSADNIFENVSFRIDTDWKLGFTGRNGRGKTTFMRLLMGEQEYSGKIISSVDFEYFPFPVADENTLVMYLAEEICPNAENWELIKEFSLLEISDDVLYRPFSTLSGGEMTKVMLAMLFLRENCFLLIDEPTNHLDRKGREIVSRYLKRKKGFILISHDRAVLDDCIDHVLSINRTNIEIEQGNYSSWEKNKTARDNFEAVQNDRLKKEIKSLEAAARRAAEHSDRIESTKIGFNPDKTEKSISRRCSIARKSKKLMNRSKAMENRIEADIEKKSGLLKNIEKTAVLKLPVLKFHSKKLLSVRNLSVNYDERVICSGVSFDISEGEILALSGKNGCGKTSIIRLICGENVPHSGEIIMNCQLKISRISQDFSGLSGNLSDYAENHGFDESLFKAILRKLDFSREQFEKDIADFSDGQKKKVMIAASLCTPAHLYIWDEPLNYLDVYSRKQLEELIIACKPSMLIVEHDKTFCEAVNARYYEF
ncbi:MAG: ABC-F type ribosomal protection protein [Ruminococcus sp.]|nr:ABC-F type ribosomal protection protein [Ruminococcus sp.]